MQFSSKLTVLTAAAIQLLISSGSAAPANGSATADSSTWEVDFYTSSSCSTLGGSFAASTTAACRAIDGMPAYQYDVNPANSFTIWIFASTDCTGDPIEALTDHNNEADCMDWGTADIKSFQVDSGNDTK
ncbi:MAG: hypothetical protein M1819_003739 [Sarea resinae]|nr:MAG: hypothetical protein M1819_003739 [Sarea resinae]